MDLFVFPSHTDTFGNVVLEALASGVPAIVTPDGGPCTIVRDGETGRIVPDDQFAAAIAEILADPARHAAMRQAARAYALTASWDSVFEGVYAAYQHLTPAVQRARLPTERQPVLQGKQQARSQIERERLLAVAHHLPACSAQHAVVDAGNGHAFIGEFRPIPKPARSVPTRESHGGRRTGAGLPQPPRALRVPAGKESS